MSKPSINIFLTPTHRKVVADLFPKLRDRLKLDEKKSRMISFTLKELNSIRDEAEAALPHAETGRVQSALRQIVDAVIKVLEESEGIGSLPVSELVYQFKIALLGTSPPIWRRIQVKDGTLDDLHEHIQAVMGWTNSHLHQFEIDGETYGHPDILGGGFEEFECLDSTVTKISEIVPKDGKRFSFLYQYDFGDDWQHEVLFEGRRKAEKEGQYPRCVEGKRNAPPEDIGGVWGYAEFLEAIADPKHEEHDHYTEWIEDFDPEKFDADEITKAMHREPPGWI